MSRSATVHLSIVLARLERRLGWPGLMGLVLICAAGLWFVHAKQRHTTHDDMPPAAASATMPATAATPAPSLAMPSASDVPLLLTRIQRAALDNGLGWPKADYGVAAATDEVPASVDVRCVLKGPYPAIRSFVTTLLQDMPTLTLREFSLGRPNSDAADVEAKLTLVIYLQAGSP